MRFPILLIDPGHGCDTKGKGSPDALKGLKSSPLFFREYAWCRERTYEACDILQAEGYTAFPLVKEEYDIPLATRAERVNAYCRKYGVGNVLLASIHNNAYGKGDKWYGARGVSVYTTPGVTESDYLADEFYRVMTDEFKSPLTVRRYGNGHLEKDFESRLYILRKTLCPAVLIEFFFQDNKEDVKYLLSTEGKGSCTHVIVQGFENYVSERF